MSRRPRLRGLVAPVLTVFAALAFSGGCNESPRALGKCSPGTAGCRCYGNATCNGSLACRGGTCVQGGGDVGATRPDSDADLPTSVCSGEGGASGVISAADERTCVIRNGGHLYCWGSGIEEHQSSRVGGYVSATPVRVPGVTAAVDVALGRQNTCAACAGGEVVCWGHNNTGQLGPDTVGFRSDPVRVDGLPPDRRCRRRCWSRMRRRPDRFCTLLGSRGRRSVGTRRGDHRPTHPARRGRLALECPRGGRLA